MGGRVAWEDVDPGGSPVGEGATAADLGAVAVGAARGAGVGGGNQSDL